MRGRRISTLTCATLALAVAAAACSHKKPPETEPRPRNEPPPVTQPADNGQDAARRAAEEERARRERAMTSLQQQIYFAFDKSDLEQEARDRLQAKAQVLRDYPEIRVRIEGHCDERGTVEYNLALGERRANAAREYLIDLGIDPDRLTTVSYGEERPAVDGHNEAAWAQNRRDEFVPLGS